MTRNELIEAMARAMAKDANDHFDKARLFYMRRSTSALTALEARLGIDLAAMAEGRCVVVPVEPDDACIYAMRSAMREARKSGISGQTSGAVFRAEYARELAAYRAMIAAAKDQPHDQ